MVSTSQILDGSVPSYTKPNTSQIWLLYVRIPSQVDSVYPLKAVHALLMLASGADDGGEEVPLETLQSKRPAIYLLT